MRPTAVLAYRLQWTEYIESSRHRWGATVVTWSRLVTVTLIPEGAAMPLQNVPVPAANEPLRKLLLIESIGTSAPFAIVPVKQCEGTAMPPQELADAKVQWARRAGYTVITRDVPEMFAPYNAVIRVSDRGTEDLQRDYLAELAT